MPTKPGLRNADTSRKAKARTLLDRRLAARCLLARVLSTWVANPYLLRRSTLHPRRAGLRSRTCSSKAGIDWL